MVLMCPKHLSNYAPLECGTMQSNILQPVFEETCCLHFPQHPENGGNRFLKIICTFIAIYLTTQHHIPEDCNLEFTTYTYLILKQAMRTTVMEKVDLLHVMVL